MGHSSRTELHHYLGVPFDGKGQTGDEEVCGRVDIVFSKELASEKAIVFNITVIPISPSKNVLLIDSLNSFYI